MNERPGISKSVLVLVSTGIAISFLLIWYGWSRRAAPVAPEAAVSTTTEAPVASVPVAEEPAPTASAAPWAEGELPPVIPLSLAGLPVGGPTNQWFQSAPFLALPRGTQSFGGIEFWLDGVIALQGRMAKEEYRQNYEPQVVLSLWRTNALEGKPAAFLVGSNIGSAHLLGATHYKGEVEECAVAELVWHYTDGSSRRTRILFQNHVRDWMRFPYETPAFLPYPFSKVVWRGENPNQPARKLRLYRFSYANPQPAKALRQLEFVTAMVLPQLFLMGVTLDPLPPGARPDPSPNLEPTDAQPGSRLEVFVQNSDGSPVMKAKVHAQAFQLKDKTPEHLDWTTLTDQGGSAQVTYPPPRDLDRLEVSVSHEDYAGRKVTWSPSGGDQIPPSYVFKLDAGVTIGGVVVDESDQPITGAKIGLYRYWRGGEEPSRKGEQSNFTWRNVSTDTQGKWQAGGLPGDLLGNIGFNVSHTNYLGTNFNVQADARTEEELRAGTFKTVLRAGQEVRGWVLDEAGAGLPEARVWAGSRFTSGRQERKTDDAGRFSFRNLASGDVQFSVMARGKKPEAKTVPVKPDMPEIVFRLARGQLIRALVQNESGEPLPGTRASLESYRGGVVETHEFSTTTDQNGRFEWNGAPDEPVQFYFYKAGYEQKRGEKLEPNKENVVTLRKSRKVQGWVLDSTTQRPITKFRVGVGNYRGPDQFWPDYPGMKDFSDPNGAFTLELREESHNGIKGEADDYAEKIEKLPAAQGGVIQVVLRLKPSPALRGVLVSPEGVPVAGGTVAFTTGGFNSGARNVALRNGRLTAYGSQNKVVTTDAAGQFTLPSPPEAGLVVGAAAAGFAMASIEQVRQSGRLVLQTYGGIEGTFKVGGQPVAGQEFMFSMMDLGIQLEFDSYKAVTDAQGRFTINRIPAGAGQLVRLVKTSARSWQHSHNTDVTIQPGRMSQVTLGDSGAVLTGRVVFETMPAEAGRLTISGNLSAPMPERPQFENPADAQAYYASPEWRELMRQRKTFGVVVGADGALMLDSVPPGTYTLNITASQPGNEPWESKPVAQGQATVVVPDNASPYFPIPIGEVVLKPLPQPVVRP